MTHSGSCRSIALDGVGDPNSSPSEAIVKRNRGYLRLTLAGILLLVLGYLTWQCFWWRRAAEAMAEESGHGEAVRSFRAGMLNLWEINPTNDFPRFSGRRDGPFDVWWVEYHPEIPGPILLAQQRKFEAYNLQMRRMIADPGKFKFGIDRARPATNQPADAKAP